MNLPFAHQAALIGEPAIDLAILPQAVRLIPGEGAAGPSWLVVASPHSGRHYPAALLAASKLDLHRLRRAEDAWVDHLFASAPHAGATFITTDYARCWLDLNRAADELDPQLIKGLPVVGLNDSLRVQAGLGVIPRTVGEGGAIYRHRIERSDAEARLAMIYRPYHAALDTALSRARTLYGASLLLDCHSMPSGLSDVGDADVVLGDRFGIACARSISDAAMATLKAAGLKVTRNAPFAGGHITELHGQPGAKRHALQIELRRGLYMNEATMEPHSGFAPLRAVLEELVAVLANNPVP
jgi:N-formylglutamate amidohydrolase